MDNVQGSGGKIWFRMTALLLGFGLLVWLAFEDQNTFGVIVFSGAVCIWLAVRILFIPPATRKQLLLRHTLIGSGVGLILAPLAIFLMALKTGIHGHGTPDFTVEQIQIVLSRTPIFALSGFLLGLGSGLWRLARIDSSQERG
jgi:succinate-acetate transporter protein